jgi:hypothetical protein
MKKNSIPDDDTLLDDEPIDEFDEEDEEWDDDGRYDAWA